MSFTRPIAPFSLFILFIALPLAPVACSLVVSSELDSKDPTISSNDAGAVVDAPIDVVNEPEASIPVFCDASDPDLAACYQFEVAENLGLDESQYGNHASASDVSTMAGISGAALLHGPTSVVRIADSPSLDVLAITIEAWIHPTELPALASRFGVFDNDGQYGLFLLETGQMRCSASVGSALDSTPTIPLHTWTHVAFSYDGATLAIYLDGERTDEIATTGEMSTSNTNGSCIGANSPSGDQFIGAIDQLRVWSRARSDQEICEAAGACTATM